jgi:hypothetical protein
MQAQYNSQIIDQYYMISNQSRDNLNKSDILLKSLMRRINLLTYLSLVGLGSPLISYILNYFTLTVPTRTYLAPTFS